MTAAIATTYQDVARTLFDTAHRFRRAYGGDVDELVGEAHLVYMKVYHSYNATPMDGRRANFNTWCRLKAWYGMQERARRLAVQRRREPEVEDPDGVAIKPRFDLGTFLGEISEDAAHVASLALDPPEALSRAKGRRCVRLALRLHLTEDMAWEPERVDRAFKEIEESL